MIALPLATPPLADVPNLHRYDAIVIASSAGKDSQTALRHVMLECGRQGYPRERVYVAHADLGRVEWPGVVELARAQAQHYGLDLRVVRRAGEVAPRGGRCYAQGETYGDLLHHIRRMGHWPRAATRYCTADHKRDRITAEIGRIARSLGITGRPARVLNVMGLRAGESSARAKLPASWVDYASSRREVVVWLPLHAWTEAEVWRDVWASGVPWHWAYDWGMPRLSCSFCIFASRSALRTAAIMRPELAMEYGAVEVAIGHRFRVDLSIFELSSDIAGRSPLELARRYGHEPVGGWQA